MIMKSYKTISTSKLVKRFDIELQMLLINDLKNNGKVKQQLINTMFAA
jgi:hypothetical protein